MKRFITTALIGCGLCGSIEANPSPDYSNYGEVDSPITIDAIVFQNFGTFDVDNTFSLTNYEAGSTSITATYTPFVTQDTAYFTNTGLMEGAPGFRFDTGTATTRFSANTFYNSGSVLGQDTPSDLILTENPAGDSINFPLSGPEPSDILIFATNIINTGSLTVGNLGLLQLTGSNISVANSSMSAGTVSQSDPNDVTGQEDVFTDSKTASYFVDPPQVYDLAWGISNAQQMHTNDIVQPSYLPGTYDVDIQIPNFNFRGNGGEFIEEASGLTAYAFSNVVSGTNIFINVVFVNTNLLASNIMVTVGFGDVEIQPTIPSDLPTSASLDNGGTGEVISFTEAVPDAISGDIVTNGIYFLDSGAEITSQSLAVNAAYVNGYDRPISFEISTAAPGLLDDYFGFEFIDGVDVESTNVGFTPSLLNEPGGSFKTEPVSANTAIYEAQVGRDPEVLDGVYQSQLGTNLVDFIGTTNGIEEGGFTEFIGLDGGSIDLPDPTNEAGRIEIRGNNVNLANVRFRAEGVVTLNATNLIGSPMTKDWGNINSDLNVTGGSMIVSNIFPTNFQRLRGDITAWSADWQNTQTNINVPSGTNATTSVTNNYYFHVLVLQPDLRGNFISTIRNLTLRATNTVVQDSLRVIDNALILASNLTFNSSVTLTQNAGSLMPTNVPNLQNFFINTNGGLAVDNIIDLGFNTSVGHVGPLGRAYTMLSVTNLGAMSAIAPLLQCSNFENDGSITASGGSIVIEAAALGLGLTVTNSTNSLIAEGSITLSANSMALSNSQIFAGGLGGSGQLLLESTATGQIADFVPGVPGTNNVLVNFWQVTDGFSLPIKPATGDLFGTEITTIATNYTMALHTWAGIDVGPVPAGFADNMVIGHLKLSRQSTNAVLHFTGASTQNGMYVDYLELDTNSLSYSDYRDGLIIDPNLTIYFAAANVNPIKLEEVYSNRLIWVTNFTGPNSTVAVPYYDSTNFCLLNSNVAFSPDISFFPPVPNSDNQPYVLNDPNNPSNFISCPTDLAMLRDLAASSRLQDFNFESSGTNVSVVTSTVGKGTITPLLKKNQVAVGKNLALTAVPAAGWVFDGWSASGLSDNVDTYSKTLKFTVQNDLVLTANFKAKTYTVAQGVYYGLFTNGTPGPENSGWFTFTLGQSGALSGRLLMGPTTYAFSSTFPSNGTANVTAKHGSDSLKVTLNLDLANPTGEVTGTVSNGTIGSQLLGYIAPLWKTPPYTGRYTMILTNSSTYAVPTGDSYGAIAVNKEGVLSVAGQLADGNAFSQSVPLSTNGLWPFYTYVAKGNDFLLGWIDFQVNEFGSMTLQGTNLIWSKGASSALDYPAGFINSLDVDSSPYSVPGKDATGLALANPVVILSGAGLAESLTNFVASNGKVTYTNANLTLSIDPGVGTFTGRLDSSPEGLTLKLGGVVLQNQEGAFGFFLGTNNESGAVLLQNQESQ